MSGLSHNKDDEVLSLRIDGCDKARRLLESKRVQKFLEINTEYGGVRTDDEAGNRRNWKKYMSVKVSEQILGIGREEFAKFNYNTCNRKRGGKKRARNMLDTFEIEDSSVLVPKFCSKNSFKHTTVVLGSKNTRSNRNV